MLTVGSFECNCYILVNTPDIVIVDPGSSPRRIIETVSEYQGCTVKGILLTHGHFDHIGAVDDLYNKYHCPVFACQDDEKILTNKLFNSFFNQSATVKSPITWLEGDILKLGSMNFEILYTPGHTAGSVMYMIDNSLFSGDTLFRESVGRTDLYSGSYSQLLQSLKCLDRLPYDMNVYPGHGPMTTIAHETENNPFLR